MCIRDRPYDRSDIEAELIGTTPLEWDAPRTTLAIQVELDGYVSQTFALRAGADRPVALRALESAQADALYVSSRNLHPANVEARLASNVPARLGEFLIDRYEVTNQEFQEFVDAGGYENQDFWIYPLEKEGVEVIWSEAIGEFVDLTGRPGPGIWTAGRLSLIHI